MNGLFISRLLIDDFLLQLGKPKMTKKYKRLFIWGAIVYWCILRLIYLHSIVNGFYLIGQLIWGCVVGLIIYKENKIG